MYKDSHNFSSKSFSTAVSLAGIFGIIGIHHFYIGNILHGLFDISLLIFGVYFLSQDNFIGAKVLQQKIQLGVDIKILYLEVDVDNVDARGNEPVYHNNKVVGVVTSGGYGFRSQKSLAFAYVKSDLVETSNLEIEIQGKKRKAKILHEVVYDPENKKLTA